MADLSEVFLAPQSTEYPKNLGKYITVVSLPPTLEHSGWSVPMLKPYLGLQNGDSTLPRIAILTSLTAKNIYFH